MKPDFIYIAIQRPDGGVSMMMFITTEYIGQPLTPEQVEVKVQASIADWKKQKLKYEQRDIDSIRRHYENSHIRWTREATEENIQSEIQKAGIEYTDYRVIDSPPQDRAFRAAWKLSQEGITHDMEKCKAIFMDRVRLEREARFHDVDREFLIAQQKQQDTTEIAEQAQHLRDLPGLITEGLKDLSTVEEIKNYQIQWQKQK